MKTAAAEDARLRKLIAEGLRSTAAGIEGMAAVLQGIADDIAAGKGTLEHARTVKHQGELLLTHLESATAIAKTLVVDEWWTAMPPNAPPFARFAAWLGQRAYQVRRKAQDDLHRVTGKTGA